MNKDKISALYERYSNLPKEDLLAVIKDQQNWQNINHGAIATGISGIGGAVAIFAPILAHAASDPIAIPLAIAGSASLAITPLIGKVVERIKGYSDYTREALIDMVSKKENIPKDQVFSKSITSGDQDALIALAFEKHKTIANGSRNFETDSSYKSAPSYRYTNIKYEAINMDSADRVFFDNAYKSLENRYGRSDLPHDADRANIKSNIAQALLHTDNGKLSGGEFKRIENIQSTIHDSMRDSRNELLVM